MQNASPLHSGGPVRNLSIVDTVDLRAVRQIKFENADEIGRKIVALFNAGQFDVCTLFFSRFKSVIAQIPTAQQLIPALFPQAAGATYEYEPDEEDILAELLPRNISVQVFRALMENTASF
jgi:F-type H+-transporting ATPase subunit gamma